MRVATSGLLPPALPQLVQRVLAARHDHGVVAQLRELTIDGQRQFRIVVNQKNLPGHA